MSFIIGCFGKNTNEYKNKILTLNLNVKYKFENENYFILADGIKETCNAGKVAENTNFISVGIGINTFEDGISFLHENNWRHILKNRSEEIHNTNGHFILIEFSKNKLTVFSDALGMREFYFFLEDDNLIFSTLTDLLTKIKRNVSLKLNEFASAWLLNFQLNFGSGIQNIQRLGPGGKLIFENGIMQKTNSIWEPKIDSKIDNEIFLKNLKNFSTFPIENSQKLSLAFSGGLDSRLLFSILNSQEKEWYIHSFGKENHPDVKMANRIARHFDLEIENFNSSPNSPSVIIRLLENFFRQTSPIIPAYEILNANLNSEVYAQNKIIIDGAFGEIFRRQFFYTLSVNGKKALINFNPNEIFKYLKGAKADIFTEETIRIMEESCLHDISSISKYLPQVERENIHNWIDQFSIIFKLPNIFGLLQSFADNISTAYMPFVQRDILNMNFSITLHQRKNGKLFRDLIKKNSPELSKFPLIKNNVKYPFSFGAMQQRIFLKLKNRFGITYHSIEDQTILDLLKDYIYDEINSINFKNFNFYDHNKIVTLVNNYYSGQTYLATELNWFLSFNTWRKFNLTNEGK